MMVESLMLKNSPQKIGDGTPLWPPKASDLIALSEPPRQSASCNIPATMTLGVIFAFPLLSETCKTIPT